MNEARNLQAEAKADTRRRALSLLAQEAAQRAPEPEQRPKDPASVRLAHCATQTEAKEEIVAALAGSFIPWPGLTEAGDRRYTHADLVDMDDQRLWQEAQRAQWLLAWCDRPDAWLSERYRAVQAERGRRKAGANG